LSCCSSSRCSAASEACACPTKCGATSRLPF